jgi:hypothetical protein
MPGPYSFPATISPGDPGLVEWGENVGAALTEAAPAATPNVMALRDGSGRLHVASPAAGDSSDLVPTTAFVAGAVTQEGTAVNPHTSKTAARNAALPVNFWQYTGVNGIDNPVDAIAGDQWISA